MKILKISSFFMLLFMLFACNEDKKAVSESASKYTCPMHPQIVQDEPGTCPICKMDLVPINQQGNKAEIMLSESQIQLSNIKTMKVGVGQFTSAKVVNARLVNDAELIEIISNRFPGRIEKLFVKETGRRVNAGEPVFSIYSEELATLQRDYQLQVKQVRAFPNEKIYQTLKEAAKSKLKLYGFTGNQISELEKNNRVAPIITVFTKASGIVREISISEGDYIAEGSPVLQLENLDQLWVEGEIYPSEMGQVKKGTSVKVVVNGVSEKEYKLKIDYISPQINPGTQMLTIRGQINNSNGILQPGMQATMFLPDAEISHAIALPQNAVIRKEDGAHVWVKKGNNIFEPKKISTGSEDADQIIVTSGLKSGEEVVTSGAYLLYSEFVLKKGAEPLSVNK